MRLGFVGTGKITESVVKGLLRSGIHFDRITLSPRTRERAMRLATLDDRISVAEDNQAVVDASGVVCLAVLPQHADAMLPALRFSGEHHVISFIATYSAREIRQLLHEKPTVVRAVPVPMVENLQAPTAICPADPIARQLFDPLGSAIEIDQDAQYDALCAFAGVMASFYAVLDEQVAWLAKQGVDYGQAKAYVTKMYLGLADAATRDGRPLQELAADYSSKGGLNEQMLRELSDAGVFATFKRALDNLLGRIKGAH